CRRVGRVFVVVVFCWVAPLISRLSTLLLASFFLSYASFRHSCDFRRAFDQSGYLCSAPCIYVDIYSRRLYDECVYVCRHSYPYHRSIGGYRENGHAKDVLLPDRLSYRFYGSRAGVVYRGSIGRSLVLLVS